MLWFSNRIFVSQSLNPLDSKSVCLCPFQYCADTKRFIVHSVSAICQSFTSLIRKEKTAKTQILCTYF